MGVGDRGGERKCSTVNPAFKGSGRAGGLDSYLHLPCALPFRQPGAALEAGFGAEALAAPATHPAPLLPARLLLANARTRGVTLRQPTR
jgi:hypothetical protein